MKKYGGTAILPIAESTRHIFRLYGPHWLKLFNFVPPLKPLKKISAILLLLLFLFSTAGYYVFYSLQLQKVKEDVKKQILAGVPDTLLEVIEHTDALQWEKDGDEFFYNGDMYDVVRTEIKNGKTIYHCINDKKEKELLKKFARETRSAHHPTQGKNGKQVVKIQLPDFAMITLPGFNNEEYRSGKKYFSYTETPVSSYQEIALPPPKA